MKRYQISRLYSKAIVINTDKEQTLRSVEQNRKPKTEIDSHRLIQLIFDKGVKSKRGKKKFFLTSGTRIITCSYGKK